MQTFANKSRLLRLEENENIEINLIQVPLNLKPSANLKEDNFEQIHLLPSDYRSEENNVNIFQERDSDIDIIHKYKSDVQHLQVLPGESLTFKMKNQLSNNLNLLNCFNENLIKQSNVIEILKENQPESSSNSDSYRTVSEAGSNPELHENENNVKENPINFDIEIPHFPENSEKIKLRSFSYGENLFSESVNLDNKLYLILKERKFNNKRSDKFEKIKKSKSMIIDIRSYLHKEFQINLLTNQKLIDKQNPLILNSYENPLTNQLQNQQYANLEELKSNTR